jgi:large subunit ribosomal protein L13
MKTYSIKPTDIKKQWRIIDAEGQILGRLASEVAQTLRGKNKPTFVPHLDCGDNVIVINAAKIKLTGAKWTDKLYQHHTGYMGGIKQIAAQDMMAKHPTRMIEIAVKGMLPKSKLGRLMYTNLRVYADDKHGQDAQKPVKAEPRLKR